MKRILFVLVFVLAFAGYAWATESDTVDEATVSCTVPTYGYWFDRMDDYPLTIVPGTPAGSGNTATWSGSDVVTYYTNDQAWDMTASWAVGTMPAGTLTVNGNSISTFFDAVGGVGDYTRTVTSVTYTLASGGWIDVVPGYKSGTLTLTASNIP